MSEGMKREQVVEYLKLWDGAIESCGDCEFSKARQSLNMAIAALSAEPMRWIPVSERLPEEETDVLICNADGEIALSRGSYSTEAHNHFIWYTSGWQFGDVIAWMPLPESYRESEGE